MNLAHQRKVYALALPIMLSNATVPLVGIVDTAVMGRMGSPAYLSAVAVGAILFSSIFWVFGFLKMGTGGLVAQAMGRSDGPGMQQVFMRSLAISLTLAVCLMALGAPLLAVGLYAMGGSNELHELTRDYFFVRLWGAPATLLLYTITGALIGQQSMRAVFWQQLLLNVLNIVLNIVFFTLTDWHVKGVAFATIISEYVAMAVGMWWLRKLWFTSAQTWLTALKNTPAFLAFVSIGRDLFIRTLGLTFAFYWITVLGSRLGDTTLALNTILMHIVFFTSYALDGFTIAAEALAGHALGKRDRKALTDDVLACTWGALVLAVLMAAVYSVSGQSIVNAMTTLSEVRDLAPGYLIWVVIAPLIGVWSFLLDGIFAGTTHTKEMRNGMVLSVITFVIAAELLVPLWGNHGLWLSYSVLMIARAITLGIWLPRIFKAADAPIT